MASDNLIDCCSVGKHVHSPCFLTRYVKEKSFDLSSLEDLDEDIRQTIQFRTNMKQIPSICLHHRATYTTNFKHFKQSKKCDNPFGTHLKTKRPLGTCTVVLSSCVKLSCSKTNNFHVYPGQHLCLDCYKKLQLLELNISEKELPNLGNNENASSDTSTTQINTSNLIKVRFICAIGNFVM